MERDWRNFSLQTLDEDVANVGFNAVFFLLSFLNPRINAITITHRFDLEARLGFHRTIERTSSFAI